MAKNFTIEIDDAQYEGQTVSAKSQMEALHIAMRTNLIVALKPEEPSDMAIVSVFAGMEYKDVQTLAGLLTKDIKRSDGVPVAENLFQDNIQDYYLFIAYVARENLAGFWKLRRQTADRAAEQTA